MIYTHARQESVIHYIAAANSLYTPSLPSVYLRSCLMVGEITSQNVYIIQIYKHNHLVKCLICLM